MKKRITSALNHAGQDTTHYLSAHLRQEAAESGWPSHVVNTLRVEHKDGSFSATVHDNHLAEALDYEYGTPSMRPTAAIRRASNRTKEAEHFYVNRLMKHLGVK